MVLERESSESIIIVSDGKPDLHAAGELRYRNVHATLRNAIELWATSDTSILVAETLQNPNNLGMVLRTAVRLEWQRSLSQVSTSIRCTRTVSVRLEARSAGFRSSSATSSLDGWSDVTGHAAPGGAGRRP
jgi:tRNA G18 (ribose-2'-O)-methylase SpoU